MSTQIQERKKREPDTPLEGGSLKKAKKAECFPLPPEIWAAASEYLPYSDVMNLAAVSTTFLHQIIPKVTHIHLFNPRELHVSHAKRLQAAETVIICCLLKKKERRNANNNNANNNNNNPRDDWSFEYSVECKNRIIPYLSALPKLQYTFLGVFAMWRERSRRVWDGKSNVPSDRTVRLSRVESRDTGFQEHHRSLVDSFCGAFASGLLKPNFRVDGLYGTRLSYCTRAVFNMFGLRERNNSDSRQPCERCKYVLDHFPAAWLVNARGSFICAPAKTRLQAVVSRGATASFHNSKFLERLFAESLVAHTDVAQQHSHTYVRRTHMEELRALCQLNLVDPKTFDMKVFFKYLKRLNRADNTADLKFSRKDFNALLELGFKTSEDEFKKRKISLENMSAQPGRADVMDQIRHHVEAFNQQLAGNAEVHVEVVNGGDAPNGFGEVFQRIRNVVQARLGEQNGIENLNDIMGGQIIGGPGGDAIAIGPLPMPMPFPMGGPFLPVPPPGDHNNRGGNNNPNAAEGNNQQPGRMGGGFGFRIG